MNCTILSLLVFNEKDQTIFLNFALHAHAYIDNEKVWRGLLLVILDFFSILDIEVILIINCLLFFCPLTVKE